MLAMLNLHFFNDYGRGERVELPFTGLLQIKKEANSVFCSCCCFGSLSMLLVRTNILAHDNVQTSELTRTFHQAGAYIEINMIW